MNHSLGYILQDTLDSRTQTPSELFKRDSADVVSQGQLKVKLFFEFVKLYLTLHIRTRDSQRTLGVLVDGRPESPSHAEIHKLLKLSEIDPNSAFSVFEDFGATWNDFKGWAHSNGLFPSWVVVHEPNPAAYLLTVRPLVDIKQ